MNGKTLPPAYHHKVKNRPQGFQRQSATAVRARSKATYHADPEKAKAMGAGWAKENPEKRREYSSLWWKRNKHRPEVQEANRLKARRRYARRKAYRSLMIV
jgi:hypothetical protein